MTFLDGQDTETDVDNRYRYPSVNTALDNRLTAVRAGVKVMGPGWEQEWHTDPMQKPSSSIIMHLSIQ